MEPDAPLDFALFQLSPGRSRCELVVSGNGRTEKIASGSVKPFVAHLRAAEEQAAAQPPQPAIRLQLERRAAWFSKGTLERFVRFVSTPEVLEVANTFDAEMSQLEGARRIYAAQGVAGGATSGAAAEASAAAADITKKELLRAIDVRISALKQDLVTSCARASSAGFNHDSVSELLLFADHFGANRLSEACNKYMSLCQRRPDINPQHAPPAASSHWKSFEDGNLRGSCSSDMSIDEPQADNGGSSNKSISGGGDLHIDKLSNSQHSVDAPSEHVTEQHSKLTIQQAVDKQEKETDAPPAPAKELSRRLSVQDRISMFENKQKEQTSTSGNSNSAGTVKVVPVKGEHRRVPSIASMDKLVRRWSSVSDMSIDLSNNDSSGFNDKSENGTPAGTPTSANMEANSKVRADKDASGVKHPVTSQSWSCQKDGDIPKDDSTTTNTCSSSTFNATSPSSLSAIGTEPPNKQTRSCSEGDMAITSSTDSELSFEKEGVNQGQGSMRMSEHVASDVPTRTRLKTSPRSAQEALPKHHNTLTSPSSEENVQMIDKEIASVPYEVPVTTERVGQKDNRGSRLRSKEIHAEADSVGRRDRSSRTVGKMSSGVDPKPRSTSSSRNNFRGSSGRDEASSTETEVHDVSLQRKSVQRKVEDARRKVAVGSELLPPSDKSGRRGINLSRQSSNAEQELSLHEVKVKSVNDGNVVPLRPAKGNQDRHDELQMKANELEKLFAAHMLTTSRRGKPTDAQVEDTPSASELKPTQVLPEKIYTKQTVERVPNNFDTNELLKMADNEGYNDSTPEKLGILSLEESRGKFYDQYTQKRDAKLKEDWKLQKEQKEAILKAMHESLERSKAEMRAKFSRSGDVSDSTNVSRCAQKVPPLQSVIRNKDQWVDPFLVEEETNSDYLSGDGSSRSADSRKHSSKKVAYTQTSITHVHVHKHSSRTVTSGYANRRNPPENPLAQSVPNFSDFRKENTKPSAGLSRVSARAQPKSFSRSKSIIEESKSILDKDQSRGSQSMRKNLNASELRDSSSVGNWVPSRSNTHKSGVPKSFLSKGNGAHPAVGIAGFRAPMFANVLQNEDDDDFLDQEDDSPDDAKDEEYESIEENLRESDFPADSDSENPRPSHEFGNSDDLGSENGDVPFPREATTVGDTKFNAFAENMRDLPGELPAPWTSHPPHLFPYANDASDGDAFVDSPTGSPSPWNSHSLDQITDADVSRMRKKWGSAQMPFVGANASQQPRKDVTKGFKKLLKFGRKNRGSDGLVNDWVSASTASECDDDMEDGRDLAIGSSDDFRKSRMGYLSSYDGFVENEVFTEQEQSLRSSIPNAPANFRLREDQLTGSSIKEPRSFFSLSTFRNKGSDARLR
ncbi:uncharacterized protein LOC100830570 isoform X1 [Brachypodium distachyon]|uniref:Uncharacterized protein n=1 Tax=Brachypodium distachyon TaxID=15368 RepID=I1GS57_BRADI|nr:uncharacterized protein LOC100830570 isoform X1 [Brachypodium distachyon]KQK15129.1 hypothetical protein BRADI_1g20840v3 [Brachypodium distachyon]|eukprot:XP_003559934.1 uncharacterized protein LOC100830570 isoform X1 [Brachypodium distachyon]